MWACHLHDLCVCVYVDTISLNKSRVELTIEKCDIQLTQIYMTAFPMGNKKKIQNVWHAWKSWNAWCLTFICGIDNLKTWELPYKYKFGIHLPSTQKKRSVRNIIIIECMRHAYLHLYDCRISILTTVTRWWRHKYTHKSNTLVKLTYRIKNSREKKEYTININAKECVYLIV